MKVLLLDLGKSIRGGQRQVFYLARALAETNEFEPLVALPGGAPARGMFQEANIPVADLPSHSDLNPLNLLRLLRIIRGFAPDIVHTNDAKGASLAAFARKWRDFKLVHSRRVSYPLKKGWSLGKYLAGDAVVAVSEEIRQVLVDCSVPEARTSTIHSGIDPTFYTTEKDFHQGLTIGGVGSLSSQKGFGVLLNSLAMLGDVPDMPDWRCLIAGDGALRGELEKQATDLGLSNSVQFLGYRESRDVLPDLDILVIPSVDGEGSNAVIKEGWATHTPVIASNLPSNLELVTHERDGLVFENRDHADLARAMVRLAGDPKLRARLVQGGSRSLEGFTAQTMARRYMDLYRTLVH